MMNEDEFDDDDDYKMSEVEEWYDNNFMYFNKKDSFDFGVSLEVTHFYETIYRPVMTELAKPIRQLMYSQYPIIETEFRPLVLKHIDWIISKTGHRFLIFIFNLVQDQENGINLKEKYPKFEEWRSFYANPPEPPVPNYNLFDYNLKIKESLTEEQLKEIAEESCAAQMKKYVINEKLKTEFYNVFQPIVFKHFPALQDFDTDSWIIYSVDIREEYEDFKFRCQHVDSFIEYEMDEEDIDLNYKDYHVKFTIKFREIWERDHPAV